MRSIAVVTVLVLAGTVSPHATAAPVGVGNPVVLGAGVYGVALAPGQVLYTKRVADDRYDAVRRFTASTPGSVSAGPEHPLASNSWDPTVGGSAGRLYYDGKHRTYTGQVKPMDHFAGGPVNASGNRALTWGRTGSPPLEWRTSFDARTGGWFGFPKGVEDLSGNIVSYADDTGSVWLRNLGTGNSSLVRGDGGSLAALANHGQRWVAWATGCPNTLCAQTLVIVDRLNHQVWVMQTRGTQTMDISGGYLALDVVPGAASTRQLRVIRLGTRTPIAVGSLPQDPFDGGTSDMFNSAPPHFDLEDENIAWIDRDHVGRLTGLPAFVDPPFYLGNLIAPASFSPNGDGRGDIWAMAFPVSKALPSCTVMISRAGKTVRVLNCANGSGMAFAAWNGRTASGAKLPAGRYTIRVTGRDADGWLRHHDQTLKPITFWTDKTA